MAQQELGPHQPFIAAFFSFLIPLNLEIDNVLMKDNGLPENVQVGSGRGRRKIKLVFAYDENWLAPSKVKDWPPSGPPKGPPSSGG